MTRITGQPPPQTRETVPASKETPKAKTDGVRVTATVQMEALAQRVKSGKAVAQTSLLTQHAEESAPGEGRPPGVAPRWAVQSLLQDQEQSDAPPHQDLPEIPLDDVPYEVTTSPLGRAYRAVRWLKCVAEAAELTEPTPAQAEVIALIQAHQGKRRALAQAEQFFRAERERIRAELLKRGAAADARFTLPAVILVSPPIVELAELDTVATEAPPANTLGGGAGTLADLELLLTTCAERKGQLIDEAPIEAWLTSGSTRST